MDYKEYQNVRDIVWELLIRHKIDRLPVRVSEICRKEGIKIKLCDNGTEADGYSTVLFGTPCIYYNDKCAVGRQRFTVAHELGHILLGHVGKYELVNREPSPNDNPIEQAANVFASRLLAPACVLWGCGVKSHTEIMQLCDISETAAKYRMERMNELYRRNKFLTSPIERQVFRQFEQYISDHRL